jgi:hypothetical protein
VKNITQSSNQASRYCRLLELIWSQPFSRRCLETQLSACLAEAEKIMTDLPPLSLSIMFLEQSLIVWDSVFAVVISNTPNISVLPLSKAACSANDACPWVDLPPSLLLPCSEELLSSGVHHACRGRSRHLPSLQLQTTPWRGEERCFVIVRISRELKLDVCGSS